MERVDKRWRDWRAWCEAKQAAYEKSRARWRKLHPPADVKALEAKYGIKAGELTIEQLKGKG